MSIPMSPIQMQVAMQNDYWEERSKMAEQQLEELLAAFAEFAKHKQLCAVRYDGNMDCDCGRDAVIAKARGQHDRKE